MGITLLVPVGGAHSLDNGAGGLHPHHQPNGTGVENGEVVVSVPDLIAILDIKRGEPVTTENVRAGFRVTIVGLPADKQWRTPEGIALGGARLFGYDIDFVLVEERYGAAVSYWSSAVSQRTRA